MTAQDVADLYEEIENLQYALHFWLPSVPENCRDEKVIERIFHDANLLAGYDGPVVDDAEELGWIKLQHSEGGKP
jgi:hypothetical protein